METASGCFFFAGQQTSWTCKMLDLGNLDKFTQQSTMIPPYQTPRRMPRISLLSQIVAAVEPQIVHLLVGFTLAKPCHEYVYLLWHDARWAPDPVINGVSETVQPYKWPYTWVTGVITLLIGVITRLKTGSGPACGAQVALLFALVTLRDVSHPQDASDKRRFLLEIPNETCNPRAGSGFPISSRTILQWDKTFPPIIPDFLC